MLTSKETEVLLSDLCVKLGFCLPPDDDNRLRESPPTTVEKFTDAVFVAEGLKPEHADRHLYRRVRKMVSEAFQKSLDNSVSGLMD